MYTGGETFEGLSFSRCIFDNYLVIVKADEINNCNSNYCTNVFIIGFFKLKNLEFILSCIYLIFFIAGKST